MAGATGSILTVLTPTLVLVALQQVSDFVEGATRFLLTAFTPTLVLLAHQRVSGS